MPIHVSFKNDDHRMPANFLTVWLAHPRGFPCRFRPILRVVDRTHEQHDDHDSELRASESYKELRELHWSSYYFGLLFRIDLLFLPPGMKRLHVHALRDPLTGLEEIVRERPSWPLLERSYPFSLTSFECSAILTGDLIARITTCSAHTLQHLSLLIQPAATIIFVPKVCAGDYELPDLPALRTLTLLPADESFYHSLLKRFLSHCPRLTADEAREL